MLELITAPTASALSLSEAKTWSRVTCTDDDAMLKQLISAATQAVERYLGRKLLSQAWRIWYDRFPSFRSSSEPWWDGSREGHLASVFNESSYLDLKLAPVLAVSAFKFYDVSNTENTFDPSNYYLDNTSNPGRVALNYNSVWPTLQLRSIRAIKVEFTAGYGTDAGSIPDPIIVAIKQTVASLYENRGDCDSNGMIPAGAKALLDPFVVRRMR